MSVVVMYVCKMRRGTAWHRVSHVCETRCPIMLTLGPRLPPCAAGPTGGVVSRGASHFFFLRHTLSPRPPAYTMGKKKQVRKFGEVKRLLNPKDTRLYVSCTHA